MYQQVRVLERSLRTSQLGQLRSVAHINTKPENKSKTGVPSQEWLNAKPFTEIPGPTKFELMRGFLPGGAFHNLSLSDFTLKGRKMYGDIYMVPALFGKASILMLFNPDDIPVVLHSEGPWPERRGLETMSYHRNVLRKDDFGDVIGLLGSNGEAWNKLRSAVNPILMQPKNVRLYLYKMLDVNAEFLQRIREIRDPNTLEMPDTFEDEIKRLTFESIAVVALNRQVGLIRKDRNNEDANNLFKSLKLIFDLAFDLDIKPSLWKIVRTPKFNAMMEAQDTMYDIIMKYINQSLEKLDKHDSPTEDNEEKSVLEKLLKIDRKVAVVMALDLLSAGVDTTSSTMAGILLAIAKNPEKQEKLRQELRTILPNKESQLTLDNMRNLPYLRACIKEGLRMYPFASGTFRKNGEDVVLSGYHVPKNQDIIINSNLLLSEEKYYSKPKEFIPERWLRDEKNEHPQTNPFLYMPFSYGPRSCVGKRLVDLELEITVAKLIRNFYLEFNYPIENAFKNRLINSPAIPLKFKMSEVEN